MTGLPTYVLDRVFDAPASLVWRAWTEPQLLSRWYGPNVETITHKLDLKPGGLWLVEMKWGKGSMFQRIEYQEVAPPSRLVWLHASSDDKWNVTASPQMPDWPRVLLTTVTFKEDAGKTHLRLTWVPHEASAAEISCFENVISSMGKGWDAGMKLLEALLVELKSGEI